MAYKIIISFFIIAESFIASNGQNVNLPRLGTYSTFSANANYNPINNYLVYYGINADINRRINSSSIILKNLADSSETVLEQGVINPPIGWIDSSRVLVYKTFSHLKTIKSKKLFDNDYDRVLYIYNIFSGEKIKIDSIPLKQTLSKMVVDGNEIIYQTEAFKKNRIFRYNITKKQTCEVTKLRFQDIATGNFAYRSKDGSLAYGMFDGQFFNLKILRDDQDILVETSFKYIEGLTFDFFEDRLYYAVRENDGNEWKLVLKSFSISTGEKRKLYVFENGTSFISASSLAKDKLILSLLVPSEVPSTQDLNSNPGNFTSKSFIERHLYILKVPYQ